MGEDCLGKKVLSNGGRLLPLIVPTALSGGTGLMNPSIYMDGDKLLVAIRHINYALYHAEKLKFCYTYGPLAYLNPETDMHLRTSIFIAELDKSTLKIKKVSPVIMLPIATANNEFIGLEDARLFRWEGKLYLCGVRRDADPKGIGRMELSEIEESDDTYVERERSRLPIPGPSESFCEKNWMPILTESYHFVKWMRPTEVVEYNPVTNITKTIILGPDNPKITDNFRGGSQVIPLGDMFMAVVHTTHLEPTAVKHKDATYRHHFVVFDKEFNVAHITQPFSFMDARIEFCCGLVQQGDNLLLSFGYQDNASYILEVPLPVVAEMLGVAL